MVQRRELAKALLAARMRGLSAEAPNTAGHHELHAEARLVVRAAEALLDELQVAEEADMAAARPAREEGLRGADLSELRSELPRRRPRPWWHPAEAPSLWVLVGVVLGTLSALSWCGQ